MNNNEIIEKNIQALKSLNKNLDKFDEKLSLLNKHDYNKLNKEITNRDRVELNWSLSYCLYSLYYGKKKYFYLVLLKSQNEDPKNHKIKSEMVCNITIFLESSSRILSKI